MAPIRQWGEVMSAPQKPIRVVALGGGYATINVLKSLKRHINTGRVHLTVIDKNNYHVFHGLVAEMLTGKIQPGNITSPARMVFRGADFHNAEVLHVDFQNKRVTTRRYLDGHQHTVEYDHLVIGLGSRDNLSRYTGVAQNTFRLKSYWDVFELKNHITGILELAEIETDPVERERLLTFVIAGGNFAGVEVATELDEFLEYLTKHYYPRLRYEEMRIILLGGDKTILPELAKRQPRLVRYASRFIAEKTRITVHLETYITAATPMSATTSTGLEFQARTVISCTGNAQPEIFDQWSFERDPVGRLVTDATLRLVGQEHVWSGGDCAAVPSPQGGYCPGLALYAVKAGAHIGRNITRVIDGKPLLPFAFKGLGDACSLGRRNAVGHLYGIGFTGFLAFVTWRLFMLKYLPVWNRRIRTMSNWLMWPLIGRDITSIRSNDAMRVRERLYQAGQTIYQQGEAASSMYLIRDGNVDVYTDGKHMGTLGPGEYFGELAIYYETRRTRTIVAATELRVLEIERAMAKLLQRHFDGANSGDSSSSER
jgi:NADH dehydrogenase